MAWALVFALPFPVSAASPGAAASSASGTGPGERVGETAPSSEDSSSDGAALAPAKRSHVGLVMVGVLFPKGVVVEAVRMQRPVFQWSLLTLSVATNDGADYLGVGLGGLGARLRLLSEKAEIGAITYPGSIMRWGQLGSSEAGRSSQSWFGLGMTRAYGRWGFHILAVEAGVEMALFWSERTRGAYRGLPPLHAYFAAGLAL